MPFAEHSVGLLLPKLIKLSSSKVLHNHDQLLFLGQREVVVEFDDILVA